MIPDKTQFHPVSLTRILARLATLSQDCCYAARVIMVFIRSKLVTVGSNSTVTLREMLLILALLTPRIFRTKSSSIGAEKTHKDEGRSITPTALALECAMFRDFPDLDGVTLDRIFQEEVHRLVEKCTK